MVCRRRLPEAVTGMGQSSVPAWLLLYTKIGWLNFGHRDHGLSEQSCNCLSKQCLCKSVIKNTKLNKQKAPAFLFTFKIYFTLWEMPVIHSDLLAMKGQANKEKIYFSLPQGVCRSACGAEIQAAFVFELTLKLWILLADFGTSLPAFPWRFQKNSTAPSMSRWQSWIWLSDPSKRNK